MKDFRKTRMSVVLVVVTYNSANEIMGFLSAITLAMEGVADWRLVVVDNNSSDDTVTIASDCPYVSRVIPLKGNLGYSAGLNAGIINTPGFDAYFALNPDVVLGKQCLGTLLSAMEYNQCGIVAPKLFDEHGSLLFSMRREPTILRECGEAILGGSIAGKLPLFGQMIVNPEYYEHSFSSDWATGGALLISKECLSLVGLWDESFFLYEEEVDFCLRAKDAGFRVTLCPAATATRYIGSGTGPALRALSRCNRIRLFRKRQGRVLAFILKCSIVMSEAIRYLKGRSDSAIVLRALFYPASVTENPQVLLQRLRGLC